MCLLNRRRFPQKETIEISFSFSFFFFFERRTFCFRKKNCYSDREKILPLLKKNVKSGGKNHVEARDEDEIMHDGKAGGGRGKKNIFSFFSFYIFSGLSLSTHIRFSEPFGPITRAPPPQEDRQGDSRSRREKIFAKQTNKQKLLVRHSCGFFLNVDVHELLFSWEHPVRRVGLPVRRSGRRRRRLRLFVLFRGGSRKKKKTKEEEREKDHPRPSSQIWIDSRIGRSDFKYFFFFLFFPSRRERKIRKIPFGT